MGCESSSAVAARCWEAPLILADRFLGPAGVLPGGHHSEFPAPLAAEVDQFVDSGASQAPRQDEDVSDLHLAPVIRGHNQRCDEQREVTPAPTPVA